MPQKTELIVKTAIERRKYRRRPIFAASHPEMGRMIALAAR